MKVVATICSRKKKEDEQLLPAHERYLGEHVEKVRLLSIEEDAPFFILSGFYGFIPAETLIPTYDYLLLDSAVDELAIKVAEQMRDAGVSEVVLYTEDNPNWQPYHRALQEGAQRAGASSSLVHLE